MATMLVRNAMHHAVAFLQHKIFSASQAPTLILAPLILNGASSALSSNSLMDAIWLAAPKSKHNIELMKRKLLLLFYGWWRRKKHENEIKETKWLVFCCDYCCQVTPSRKKIRNNHLSKRLKNIVHFQDCPLCNEKKLRHRLCMSCFKKGKYFV